MTQEPHQPVDLHLSVHESSDPSLISSTPGQEASGELNDLNDSVHDDENVDVPTPGLFDLDSNENVVDRQVGIANLSAG